MLRRGMLLLVILITLLSPSRGCRWALVVGSEPSCVPDLFITPNHSLAQQSHLAPLTPLAEQAPLWDPLKFPARNHGENKDGWGLGWFQRSQLKRSRSSHSIIDPLTNQIDPHLTALTNICSSVLFGHLRAVTDGDRALVNSHPFQFGPLLWMHNGGLPAATQAKLQAELKCPLISKLISGNTDSEFAGALFAQALDGDVCLRSTSFEPAAIEGAMAGVIRNITQATQPHDDSSLNFAASDGRSVVVTRHRTALGDEPPSLYFSTSSDHQTPSHKLATSHSTLSLKLLRSAASSWGHSDTRSASVVADAGLKLWIASEPLDGPSSCVVLGESDILNECRAGQRVWVPVPKDAMLSYDTHTSSLKISCLSAACGSELLLRFPGGFGLLGLVMLLVGIVVLVVLTSPGARRFLGFWRMPKTNK
eukprot:TRINITY_DN27086_c0_g1_i1.p1 TRINITY_DN27086_c0_g1~~TRINITY_DN27086_c0_g1_i1.p1  ORF type:complete len:421 (+),score=55.10 TRINITY_DN27086_c0_g1_i1:50-1312(+)